MHFIAKFLKAMNSNSHPLQIGLAMAFGMVWGLTPLMSPHNLFILLLMLLLKLNFSAFTLGWTIFTGLAYLLDPVFHQLGLFILESEALKSTFTQMYNDWFWRWLDFSNTVVMGSVVFCLISLLPVALLMTWLVTLYRRKLLGFIDKFKIVKLLKSTKIWTLYKRLESTSEALK